MDASVSQSAALVQTDIYLQAFDVFFIKFSADIHNSGRIKPVFGDPQAVSLADQTLLMACGQKNIGETLISLT